MFGSRPCGKLLVKTTTAARKHLLSKHATAANELARREAEESPGPAKKKPKWVDPSDQPKIDEAMQKLEKYGKDSKRSFQRVRVLIKRRSLGRRR